MTERLTPQEIDAALAELQEMRKPCVWTKDGFGWWKALCGGMECCLTQNPFDAGRKYCPSCGHPVEVKEEKSCKPN